MLLLESFWIEGVKLILFTVFNRIMGTQYYPVLQPLVLNSLSVPDVGTIPCRKYDVRTRGYEVSFGGARLTSLESSVQGKVRVVSSDYLLS